MPKTIRFALATAIVLGTAVAANAQSVMLIPGEAAHQNEMMSPVVTE
jgi:hypothetical protein